MRFHYIIGILLILSGCGDNSQLDHPASNSDNIEENIPEELIVEYAENFQLQRIDQGYLIEIINPNTGKIEKSFKVRNDEPKRIISLTATLNGMLSILNSTELIVGISDINYIHSPEIRKRFKQGKITEYGDETTYSIEKTISSQANTILYSGFGDEFPNHKKLEKIGFLIIPIYDWRENDPLGKAEWIKLVGILTGKEQEAIALFENVKAQYRETQNLVRNTNSDPTVISGNLIGDIWYAPAGDSYMAKMISDAGGIYKYKDIQGTGSVERSIEQILKDNHETDIWINPGLGTKRQIGKMNPHARHLKAYNNLYCYSTNMNLFWERSAAEPHLVLSDLIHIFHPEIAGANELFFYEKITE